MYPTVITNSPTVFSTGNKTQTEAVVKSQMLLCINPIRLENLRKHIKNESQEENPDRTSNISDTLRPTERLFQW